MADRIPTVVIGVAMAMFATMAAAQFMHKGIHGIWLLGQHACAFEEAQRGQAPERFVRVAMSTDGSGGNAGRLLSGASDPVLTRETDDDDIDWRYAYDIAADAPGNCVLALPPGAGLPAGPNLLMTEEGDFIALQLNAPHAGGDLVIGDEVNQTEPDVGGVRHDGEPWPRRLWLALPVAVSLPLMGIISGTYFALAGLGVWHSHDPYLLRLRHATIALSAIVLSGMALQLAFTFVFGWDFGGIDGYQYTIFWPVRGGFTEFVTSFGFMVVAGASIIYAKFLLPN